MDSGEGCGDGNGGCIRRAFRRDWREVIKIEKTYKNPPKKTLEKYPTASEENASFPLEEQQTVPKQLFQPQDFTTRQPPSSSPNSQINRCQTVAPFPQRRTHNWRKPKKLHVSQITNHRPGPRPNTTNSFEWRNSPSARNEFRWKMSCVIEWLLLSIQFTFGTS